MTEAEREAMTALEERVQELSTELGRLKKPQAKGAHPWRTGNRALRTIYDAHDQLIGVMDTPELATIVVACVALQEPER